MCRESGTRSGAGQSTTLFDGQCLASEPVQQGRIRFALIIGAEREREP